MSIIVFSIIRMIPGDPARSIAGVNATPEFIQQVRVQYTLEQPLPVQYGRFMGGLFRGDLGNSIFSGRAVTTEIGERFPKTLLLATVALVIATMLGFSAGIVSATRRNSLFDNASML